MSLKPGTGIPRPRTVHKSLYILLEMQHTQMGFHAFKMADKIARKEGHRQVFVESVKKKFLLTNWPPIIALGLSFTRMSILI